MKICPFKLQNWWPMLPCLWFRCMLSWVWASAAPMAGRCRGEGSETCICKVGRSNHLHRICLGLWWRSCCRWSALSERSNLAMLKRGRWWWDRDSSNQGPCNKSSCASCPFGTVTIFWHGPILQDTFEAAAPTFPSYSAIVLFLNRYSASKMHYPCCFWDIAIPWKQWSELPCSSGDTSSEHILLSPSVSSWFIWSAPWSLNYSESYSWTSRSWPHAPISG